MSEEVINPEDYSPQQDDDLQLALETEEEKESQKRNQIEAHAFETHLQIFKKLLFKIYVQKDKNHKPDDTGALYTYHSILLQSIAFWIGLLDSQEVPRGKLVENNELELTVESIEAYLRNFDADPSLRQVAYNALSKLATEHPFILA
jgi:hypothetical protein